MYTPPPIGQPDPDTPKKGNKRGAKAETWVPTTDELIAYVTIHRLCRTCLKTGHASRKCTTSEVEIPYAQLASHPQFAEHMQRWIEERRNTKRPARYTQCPRCLDYGHLEEECTSEPVCDHCGYLDCECDNQGEESMDEQAD